MPRGLAPEDFADNRRVEPRFESTRTIDVLPCSAMPDWKFTPAEMTDCSLHGLGLLLPMELPRGEQFMIKLIVAGKVKLLLYTVQHCAPADRSRYRVGARFSGLPTEDREESLEKIFEALLHAASILKDGFQLTLRMLASDLRPLGSLAPPGEGRPI